MANRKLASFVNGNKTAVVYRDASQDEYIAKFLIDGVRQSGADYFTDDKIDAMQTACVQIGLCADGSLIPDVATAYQNYLTYCRKCGLTEGWCNLEEFTADFAINAASGHANCNYLEASISQALEILNGCIKCGQEFPDALYTVSSKCNVDYVALQDAYDTQG
jgi:hypothetical protein